MAHTPLTSTQEQLSSFPPPRGVTVGASNYTTQLSTHLKIESLKFYHQLDHSASV